MNEPYNWLLNLAPETLLPGGAPLGGQFVAMGGNFYPNPSPANWSSPPDFTADLQPFGQGTTVTATINSATYNIPYANNYGDPYGYFLALPYNPSLVGTLSLTASHAGYATGNFQSNSTTSIPFLPIVNNVSVSTTSSDAILNWTLPSVAIPSGFSLRVNIQMFDQTNGELINFYTIPASQTSLDLGNLPPYSTTAGNPLTIPLVAGGKYVISVAPALIGPDYNQYSESYSYTSFSPSSTPAPFSGPVYLPNVITGANGTTYLFNMDVTTGTTYNIDPTLAHGFIYQIGAGDPNFASVELPNIGNIGPYALYLWESGKWVFDANLAPDTLFSFGAGGVNEFEVLGINPNLDPSNGNDFVTQVTFIGDGTFTGTMTPVTGVPEPSTWAMMLIGFAGLGYAGYRRARSRMSPAI